MIWTKDNMKQPKQSPNFDNYTFTRLHHAWYDPLAKPKIWRKNPQDLCGTQRILVDDGIGWILSNPNPLIIN